VDTGKARSTSDNTTYGTTDNTKRTVTTDYNEVANMLSNDLSASPDSALIEIVLNGHPKQVPSGLSIAQLLGFLDVNPSRVAVERNREIVRKNSWDETIIAVGDQIEVVWFVGGGVA
jgi:thiamine biosynthesis protein ThiS